MSDADKHTIIQDGTDFDGSISSRCPIEVSGSLKGELLAPALTVSESGSVHGQVKVELLESDGEISGEIEADTVKLCGKVSDKTVINAGTLEVNLSQADKGLQVTFGNCELRVGDKPGNTTSKAKKTDAEEWEPEPTL